MPVSFTSKAFLVVMVGLVSAPLIFINCVESIDLICTDGNSTCLKDRIVLSRDAGRIVFAGFCLVGAVAAIGVCAVDEGFAGECVEESVYPAAAGEKRASHALISVRQVLFVVGH